MTNETYPQATPAPGIKLPSWLVVAIIVGMLGFAWWKNHHTPQANEHVTATGTSAATGTHSAIGRESKGSAGQLPDEHEPSIVEVADEHDQGARPDAHPAEHPTASVHEPDRDSRPLNPDTRSVRPPRNGGTPDARTKPDLPSERSGKSGPLSGMRNQTAQDSHPNPPKNSVPDRQRPSEKSDLPSYQVENQSIRDLYGKVVYKGTIDLKPTLDRIERGEANRHRNDGTSFQNREGRLPRKTAGYYKEYVHPTPGENGPGPQRIIIGEEGEVWYTGDHYKSFKKIK